MKRIIVSDRTIADAVKSDGLSLSFREKTDMAKRLELVLVDRIELPSSNGSKEELIINRTISKVVENSEIVIPTCPDEKSIELSFDRISEAKKPVLQISAPVSTVRMEYDYHLKAPKMLEKIAIACKFAKEKCERVEFAAEDASRADRDFLKEVCETVAENGADSIILYDDAGIFLPHEFAELVKFVKSSCDLKVGVRVSDALGMAAAAAVECIEAGADIVVTSAFGFAADKLADIIRARGEEIGASCGLSMTQINHEMSKIESRTVLSEKKADEKGYDYN